MHLLICVLWSASNKFHVLSGPMDIHLELRKASYALNGLYQNSSSEQHAKNVNSNPNYRYQFTRNLVPLCMCAYITNGRFRK